MSDKGPWNDPKIVQVRLEKFSNKQHPKTLKNLGITKHPRFFNFYRPLKKES